MVILFTVTLFLSAALLFSVQPLIAKILLPLLGGSPAVWNTCMVFFQAALLGGYAYAHWSVKVGSAGRQVVIHLLLVASAMVFLPFAVPETALEQLQAGANPSRWLLLCLLAMVGLPFFVVSTTAPLLQRWFAGTPHPDAKDPYFLYSAGNVGSLLALLGYPLVVQPLFQVTHQVRLWAYGYGGLLMLIGVCGVVFWRCSKSAAPVADDEHEDDAEASTPQPLAWRRRLGWVVLAFVPSSLMLGVTNFFATDIASIPLLWVVPLALYLSTFTLVFARRAWIPRAWMVRVLPYSALALVFLMAADITEPVWLLILVHLVFFFVASMVCHGRMADDRPPVSHLTEFYLWMSIGGVLGGIFNALLAPVLFNHVLEYPIVIVLACLLRPGLVGIATRDTKRRRVADYGVPLAIGLLTVALALSTAGMAPALATLRNLIVLGLPVLVCFAQVDRSRRFGLGIAAILLCGGVFLNQQGKPLFADRNFFGVSRVTVSRTGDAHQMFHGNTLHGIQFTAAGRRHEPVAYYHPRGAMGDVLGNPAIMAERERIGVIGLGAGAMLAYAQPGQTWTYYEIDPLVIQLATSPEYFTFIRDSAADSIEVVPGDARLKIRDAEPGGYDVLILDAFSSDSIPAHLVTREAVGLYLDKLSPNGLLLFHISNRYLDLEPIVAALAGDANMKCLSRLQEPDPEDAANGVWLEAAHWVAMSPDPAVLAQLQAKGVGWFYLSAREETAVWTDDYSNILSVLRWN